MNKEKKREVSNEEEGERGERIVAYPEGRTFDSYQSMEAEKLER